MPKYQVGRVKFHLSLTGNSMNDPVELWQEDPGILLQHPLHIFYALFSKDIDADKRIHATSEPQGEDCASTDQSLPPPLPGRRSRRCGLPKLEHGRRCQGGQATVDGWLTPSSPRSAFRR